MTSQPDPEWLRKVLTRPIIEMNVLGRAEFTALLQALELALDQAAAAHFPHFYTIAPRTDGSWGVVCFACTHEMGDYTYPCLERESDDNLPPPFVVPMEQAELPAPLVQLFGDGLHSNGYIRPEEGQIDG